MTKIHLVSIAPSHYCEKARWALDRAGVNYTEDKHLPLLHRIYTRNLGGTSCPKLIIGDSDDRVILQDSNDILHYADKNVNQEDWLYPAEETLLNDVSAWLTKLDQKLGPHVRRWAYFYLLYHKDSYHILSNGALLWERLAGWFLMPLLRYIIYKGIRIDAPGAKDISFRKISEIFREVDMALADGRPFICGSRFTAADLTFAALGGPVIRPAGYGCWLPPIEEVPKAMAEIQRTLRETPAGKHIVKLYQSHRKEVIGQALRVI
ncbi:hypothetical protein O6H91_22G037400 [Diphasiastrum complanatum]|uniref:Uncharacterized protein n=1 Tax=Diphasiastrum complanatum TaxID=34168 RepID=A0ACC2AEJ4_DIPCM|nr:hypothetical protein O6H91_22G037400 [Diphasiastrum complanatum]